MNELKRITRKELANKLGVSYSTYLKIIHAHQCSFALGFNPNKHHCGRMPMLTITQVAEAIVKLYDFFETPIEKPLYDEAKSLYQAQRNQGN